MYIHYIYILHIQAYMHVYIIHTLHAKYIYKLHTHTHVYISIAYTPTETVTQQLKKIMVRKRRKTMEKEMCTHI